MKIYSLGHAGFFIETENHNLIIDPWLTERGAFLSSWYQFPKNHHAIDNLIEKISSKNTSIYITHEHEDHFDVDTLHKIYKFCDQIIIPEYEDKNFLNAIRQEGFDNVLELKEEKKITIKDIDITIFIEEAGINKDSAILITDKNGKSFLNLNDCKIQDRIHHIKSKYGNIDVLSQQFSGAVMHPVCYSYDIEKYKTVSKKKRRSKMMGVYRVIDHLEPDIFIPAAGPAVFLSKDLFHLNFENNSVFPKSWEFSKFLESKKVSCNVISLNPWGSIDLKADGFQVSGEAEKFNNEELKRYLKKYQADYSSQTIYRCSDKNLKQNLINEFRKKVEVFREYRDKFNDDLVPIYLGNNFDILIRIDLDSCIIESSDKIHEEEYYHHEFQNSIISSVTLGQEEWSNYFLSFRFKNTRVPDSYSTITNLLLTTNSANAFEKSLCSLLSIRDSRERIEVFDRESQTKFNCKRHCPHQGGDLKYAKIENGNLVCPRHYWKFNLSDGGACDRTKDTIDSFKV